MGPGSLHEPTVAPWIRESHAHGGHSTSKHTALRQANASDVAILGDLIDLGLLRPDRSAPSIAERRQAFAAEFTLDRADLVQLLRGQSEHPLLQHVLRKTGLDLDRLTDRISKISLDQAGLQQLNLSDVRVVDQLAFHARSVFNELEDKKEFLDGFDWIRGKAIAENAKISADLIALDAAARRRLEEFHKIKAPKVPTLAMGRGSTMTNYLAFMPPDEKRNILFVAPDMGIWHGHYQLAQTSGILELDAKSAPSNLNTNVAESVDVSHVDAHYLYKSLIRSQKMHEMPAIVGEVKKIRGDSSSGIKADVEYSLDGKTYHKTVHADSLIVGTGLSHKKNVFYQKSQFYKDDFRNAVGSSAPLLFRFLVSHGYFEPSGMSLTKDPLVHNLAEILTGLHTKNQIQQIVKIIQDVDAGRSLSSIINKEDYEALSQFHTDRGFTPIIDGNSFILSDAECSSLGKGRTILVLGGGDTAAAAVRRGLFLKDTPEVKLTLQTYEQSRVNDVVWIARNGFDTLRDGTLPGAAKRVLERAGRLWGSCELTGIEPSDSEIRIFLDRYRIVDDPALHENVVMRKIEGTVYPCIAEPQTLQVDQLVYNLGQDNRSSEQLFEGINLSDEYITIAHDPASGMPIHGALKELPNVQFHGSALTSASFARSVMPKMNEILRQENFPADVGPGSMAVSTSLIRADHFSRSKRYYGSVNATMDFRRLIDVHIQKWGVDDSDIRSRFVAAIIDNRTETRGGITTKTLNALLATFRLRGILSVDSSCMLHPLRPSATA